MISVHPFVIQVHYSSLISVYSLFHIHIQVLLISLLAREMATKLLHINETLCHSVAFKRHDHLLDNQ